MATVETDHLTSQVPPAKRARLEATTPIDNMDAPSGPFGIPGLGLLGNTSKTPEQPAETAVPPEAMVSVKSAPSPVQEPENSPADLLGQLERAISTPQAVQIDSVMEEAPAQVSTLADCTTSKVGTIVPNESDDKMETEKSQEPKTTADEPMEEVNHEIADGEQAVKDFGITEQDAPAEAEVVAEEHPEWEVDSSPIESSSDDSSSDDSSSEDSDVEGEDSYKLLDPEEQARILMEGDGGSDDEGGNKGAKGSGGQLRTKNEIPEEIIPKPDVTITPEMKIEELGYVEGSVENTILIKAKTSGEYRVLESGSVLCLEDRSVIGAVAETIGRVQQPFYSVRFTNAVDIAEAGMTMGTKIFYSEQHSTYVFTQALKAYKGSDASNLHDEEVGDEEVEFSDDEAEAEHKRKLKQKKMEKRGGKVQPNGNSGRSGHPLRQEQTSYDATVGINYDDDDDGPYKPLARPAGFADIVGRSEAPEERGYSGRNNQASSRGGRDEQSRGRGRGDRGRGRGRGNDRGRGRGTYSQPRRDDSHPYPSPGGFSKPPQGQGRRDDAHSHPAPFSGFPQPPLQSSQGYPSPFPTTPFYNPQTSQQPLWPMPVFPPQPPYQQQQFPQPYMQPGWSNNGAGAFINPAFFNGAQGANVQNQWNQQSGNGNGGK